MKYKEIEDANDTKIDQFIYVSELQFVRRIRFCLKATDIKFTKFIYNTYSQS